MLIDSRSATMRSLETVNGFFFQVPRSKIGIEMTPGGSSVPAELTRVNPQESREETMP
jgi:hypothetical protein